MNPKAKIILFVWLVAFVAQGRAQEFSAEELAHRALERRAIEAVIWGMPAVNTDLMARAASWRAAQGDFSLFIRAYWPKPPVIDGTWMAPTAEKTK